ncbi:MAG: flagellar motor protein MotB [Desulfovibrionaceae bacterium]|nr:flagellar motor protein MotB [Desulfovibrionaceae bacterium]
MAEQGHKAPIIIKKIKKGGGAAHGGQWKVAYADFVTAMMAFFLLMWLLNMTPKEKQEEVAAYFREFSLFEAPGPGAIPLETGGLGPPAVVSSSSERPDGPAAAVGGGAEDGPDEGGANAEQKRVAEMVQAQLRTALPELADQVTVVAEEGKVRIEIMDKLDRPIFERGRAVLTSDAQRILATLTGVLRKDDLKVVVEGHTDAAPYGTEAYTNWELSTDRAQAARRLMLRDGFPPKNIVMVAGFAATMPYVPSDPLDARNRRISLLLFQEPQPGQQDLNGNGSAPDRAGNGRKTEVAPAPPPLPSANELLEREIDKIYEKATEKQF